MLDAYLIRIRKVKGPRKEDALFRQAGRVRVGCTPRLGRSDRLYRFA